MRGCPRERRRGSRLAGSVDFRSAAGRHRPAGGGAVSGAVHERAGGRGARGGRRRRRAGVRRGPGRAFGRAPHRRSPGRNAALHGRSRTGTPRSIGRIRRDPRAGRSRPRRGSHRSPGP
ncbi:MAG: hypothetical protein E6G57_03260 [Actinobacteria bacterium]|nr:MAG: hypothetical protein E6G57_03260 [Actinomycetota bacterium]